LKLDVVKGAFQGMIKFYPNFKMPTVETPSNGWLWSFHHRKEMKAGKATPIEQVRSETATVGNISWWYENIMKKIKWEEYDPKFIFNADETMLRQKQKKIVTVPKDIKKPLIKDDESTEHITIMECIAANGDCMTLCSFFH